MEFHIKKYLKKFSSVAAPGDFLKNEVVQVVKKETGISLSIDRVRIIKGIAYLSGSSSAKSTIFIKKEAILSSLQKNKSGIVDIY